MIIHNPWKSLFVLTRLAAGFLTLVLFPQTLQAVPVSLPAEHGYIHYETRVLDPLQSIIPESRHDDIWPPADQAYSTVPDYRAYCCQWYLSPHLLVAGQTEEPVLSPPVVLPTLHRSFIPVPALNSKALLAYLFPDNPTIKEHHFFGAAHVSPGFDAASAAIEKPTAYLYRFAYLTIAIVLFLGIGLVFMDIPLFKTVIRNCYRIESTFSTKRTKKEIKHLALLAFRITSVLAVYLILNVCILTLCHKFIVPIPIIVKIFTAFDVDRVVWEDNIEIGMFGDIGEEYEQWSEKQGFSYRTARFWQEMLWHNWIILMVLLVYFGTSFYYTVLKVTLSFFRRYKRRVYRRRRIYSRYDISRITTVG